ncbi:AFTIN protein, partial [Polyodon spathula]|nr:AFTIN protein [Polyodon spathula]
MEPEVIRMYSSSPPPLDDGAEEEDNEFGEFGGFSGITSSVSLREFDITGFSTEREDFVPQNHFMPDKVDSFEDFDSLTVRKDRGLIAEISKQFVETRTINEISPTSKPASFSIDGPDDKEGVKRPVDETESATSSNLSMAPVSSRTDVKIKPHQTQSCNGTVVPDAKVLTNGFAAFDIPGKQANVINSKGQKEISKELSLDSNSIPSNEFADFSAFPKADAYDNCIQAMKHTEDLSEGKTLTCPDSFVTNSVNELNIPEEELAEVSLEIEGVRDTNSTGSDLVVDGIGNGEGHLETVVESKPVTCGMQQKEAATVHPDKEVTCQPVAQIGQEETGALESGVCKVSVLPSMEGSKESEQHQPVDNEVGEKGELGDSAPPSTSVSMSEDFASFCQANSPDDQDGFGDFSTTSITPSWLTSKDVPSSSFNPEEPEEHFAKFEELSSDEDFGDFGEVRDSSKQGFADFNQPKVETVSLDKPVDSKSENEFADLPPRKELKDDREEGFGDFDSTPEPKESEFADFPSSDSFADFSSATGSQDTEWNAFGEQSKSTSWAAFGEEQTAASIEGDISRKEVAAFASFQGTEDISSNLETEPALEQMPEFNAVAGSQLPHMIASLVSGLELVFQACFPSAPVPSADEEIPSLKVFLEPQAHRLKKAQALAQHGELLEVWPELQDIQDAYGLRYQWGGSHSNKMLLCSLGIDTRNILFTGQKKQPVIVPMYAASLGMLEPTKEPVKPVSAAEKIASIAQTPPVTPEMSTCTQDQIQENLPPVQFDWSSSGLTNPLDASGGSTLLNLDFFGPVDDTSSSSTTTSIPGVDPELYELTTSKPESSSTSSHVADAFARLMSTVEKTSTSARKPKTDENLSEEAAKVIASLPDLFFMQAKVLMFPTTLTPLTCSQEHAD